MAGGDKPLRIGLMLDAASVPGWIAPALTEIQERGLGEVVLAVIRQEPPRKRPSRPLQWWRNRSVLGYALIERLARRTAHKGELHQEVDLSIACPGSAMLQVSPQVGKWTDSLSDEDVATIRGYQLDILLRLGFRILRGTVLTSARHGVWSFHHGDNRTNRGGPPGVWEVLEDRVESGVTLQVLTESLDGGEVLAWAVCATQRFSFRRNFDQLLRRSSRMLVRSVERTYATGAPSQLLPQDQHNWPGYSGRVYRTPTNTVLLGAALRLGSRYVGMRARNAGKKLQWSLAWHWRQSPDSDAPHQVINQYREILPPHDRYWADPFVAYDAGRWWLFFEEFIDRENRGGLCVWEIGPTGPIGAPKRILDVPYHLSYPHVFKFQDRWYLMPECEQAGRLEIFVATSFPFEWASHTRLMEGSRIVDATLLEHEGHWYLFASQVEDNLEASEELRAFVGSSPLGPFHPHPLNPLVSDVRRARMAGRFFRFDGRLYRPAQRCVPRYGAGVVVHEVTELTPSSYGERVVEELRPRWKKELIGFHTINCAAGLSAIDVLRMVRK